MQQHVHRTLRTMSPTPPSTDKPRPPFPLSLPGVPALLLVAALAALGWRAENAALLPHLELNFNGTPAASSPTTPARTTHYAVVSHPATSPSTTKHSAVAPVTHTAASSTRQSTSDTPRVQALAPARTTLTPASRSGSTRVALPPISTAGDRLRSAMAPNLNYVILAQPSISVAVIRAELQRCWLAAARRLPGPVARTRPNISGTPVAFLASIPPF